MTTFLDKTSVARLDIVAFANPRDVKLEEINEKFKGNYDRDLELLSEVLKCSWSDTVEVQFTEDAVNFLLNKATELYRTLFSEMVTLASIDFKWKLARLSVAPANLTLSTEDFKSVILTKGQAKEVMRFLLDEFSKAGLNTLAQESKFGTLGQEGDKGSYSKVVNIDNLDMGE